jgi:signal transduction histidine kinase
MLGRQQIAGIPTALHELFKNAHDAYAEHVEVDFFRKDQLLIIRDDGYGMTRGDFEGRWLTLGTESKIGTDQPDTEVSFAARPKMPRRPIMGEKGIGRLAIAAIGPQVLVMTRATRLDGLSPLVASFIHWGLFEVPGVDLNQIHIAVEEVPQGTLPDASLIRELVNQVRANILSLGSEIPAPFRAQLLADLELANLDPTEIDKRLTGPSLRDHGYGTHFYIRPTSSVMADDIDGGGSSDASPVQKMLLGFSNTMMPGRPRQTITAEFRDHHEDGTTDELIAGNTFFTPDEFESADHHIEGDFDEYGQFSGRVTVYREAPRDHPIRWPQATGQRTECGPFRITFAYLQGLWKDTRLPEDDWAALGAKLDRIGGLYVYRNGIRILPYGRPDYDFVNIERRRTKSAGDWFFSYRRIFGAIEIDQTANKNLVEKAGREGFRENRAYRQFVSILENFFERLAIDFFREKSRYGDSFNANKEQLNREHELLKRREESTRARRKEFADKLGRYFTDLEHGVSSAMAQDIRQSLQARLAVIAGTLDGDPAARALLDLERETRERIGVLERANTIARPRSVGLTKSLQSDWVAYLKNADKMKNEVIVPLIADVDEMITTVAGSRTIALDRRRRLVMTLDSKRNTVQNESARLRRDAQSALQQLSDQAEEAIRFCLMGLATELEQTFIDVERTDLTDLGDREALRLQKTWEERIDCTATAARDLLEPLRDQLASIAKAIQARESLEETTAAIESTAEGYREQVDSSIELAQVGMALGIVQHEFGVAVKNIRGAIRKLKPWADGTPDLKNIYKDLRVEFDHLDGYLKLFTPLSRRLNRQAVDLSGEEIRHYLDEVFHDRLERHAIVFRATAAFDRMSVHGYPSTYLPAFVNVVDNAIYWITSDRDSERLIKLDSDGVGFTIWNGGPGIEHRIAERIFEFGETTKIGGRGLGLYLARESLRREGFDLTLEAAGTEVRPVFRLAPVQPPSDKDEE